MLRAETRTFRWEAQGSTFTRDSLWRGWFMDGDTRHPELIRLQMSPNDAIEGCGINMNGRFEVSGVKSPVDAAAAGRGRFSLTLTKTYTAVQRPSYPLCVACAVPWQARVSFALVHA